MIKNKQLLQKIVELTADKKVLFFVQKNNY